MLTSEILRAAKKLIDTPEKWCQNIASQLNPDDTLAFCTSGAVDFVCKSRQEISWLDKDDKFQKAMSVLNALVPPGYAKSAVLYNDANSHIDVMLLFDEAIERARREESLVQTHNTQNLIPANFSIKNPQEKEKELCTR